MTAPAVRTGPLVVLDDDPTGTQAVSEVRVLLDWDERLVADAASSARGSLHLLTNSRAFPPERAREIVRGAAGAAVAALGRPRLVLRGDSTLRAHLLEEYEALCDAAYPDRTPPLLLVPALPAAGRITLGGVHYLLRDGRRVPLHETEYASDPAFPYGDARLLQWAEERSRGFFPASAGRHVSLERLRADGPDSVAAALVALAEGGGPAACVPDAEAVEDLAAIASGLRLAEERGAEVIVRSAPTFVGVVAGNLARGHVAPPAARAGVLVVCGSHVPSTTRQLGALLAEYPGSLVELDVVALASSRREEEVARAAADAGRRLGSGRLAVLATPRVLSEAMRTFEAAQSVAAGLAAAAGLVDPKPDVVLAKGGITSAITARDGLGARTAVCHGPLVDGVALWTLELPDGTTTRYVVFPGNVGDDRTLLDVVELILGA